ncbi:hypothetical protein DICVIV_08150, partial [Dictyocaulus viviparus]
IDYNVRDKEIERQREKQRRREYEQRLNAERREHERRIEAERRRTEESRPIGVLPVIDSRSENEQRRIDELRRRDEELRRSASRRREEERRREQEQRLREEQRRREFERQGQHIRDEQKVFQEQKMKEIDEKNKNKVKTMTVDKSSTYSTKTDDIDEDVELPTLDEWDYKSDEEESTQDYIPGGGQEVGENDLDALESTTALEDTQTSTEQLKTDAVGGITKVIEMAADKTIKMHGSEVDEDRSTIAPSEDDYWDHSIKREDENYRIAEEVDSLEHGDTIHAPMNDGAHKFNAEEGEEGWMMMKRVDDESVAASLSLTTVTLILILRGIW